jgi:hypothetical protein
VEGWAAVTVAAPGEEGEEEEREGDDVGVLFEHVITRSLTQKIAQALSNSKSMVRPIFNTCT